MTDPIKGKHIILGVTGSIAAYKAADLASKLMQAGAVVDTILTKDAAEFIAPLTFRSLTHRPVVTTLFDANSELAIEHVGLALRADMVLIAPATANVLAKLASGIADDALTTTVLATRAPLLVAPAMDAHMFDHPTVQANLHTLRSRGVTIIGPAAGRLASGLAGFPIAAREYHRGPHAFALRFAEHREDVLARNPDAHEIDRAGNCFKTRIALEPEDLAVLGVARIDRAGKSERLEIDHAARRAAALRGCADHCNRAGIQKRSEGWRCCGVHC